MPMQLIWRVARCSLPTGDYEGAAIRYEYLAELGNEMAQSNAAYIYEKHFKGDLALQERGFRYYKQSAEQNIASSHLKVGDMYYYGLGTPQSYERAVDFYKAASELNSPQAMFNLGLMHQFGQGLPADIHLAKRYYDMAWNAHPDATFPVALALAGLGCHYAYDLLFVNPVSSLAPAVVTLYSLADYGECAGLGSGLGLAPHQPPRSLPHTRAHPSPTLTSITHLAKLFLSYTQSSPSYHMDLTALS